MNEGHGHVVPRDDGVRMRCGGPGPCAVCNQEQMDEAIRRLPHSGGVPRKTRRSLLKGLTRTKARKVSHATGRPPATDPEILLMLWHTRTPMQLKEIAVCMGCSHQNIQQIEKRALRKIRAALAREMGGDYA